MNSTNKIQLELIVDTCSHGSQINNRQIRSMLTILASCALTNLVPNNSSSPASENNKQQDIIQFIKKQRQTQQQNLTKHCNNLINEFTEVITNKIKLIDDKIQKCIQNNKIQTDTILNQLNQHIIHDKQWVNTINLQINKVDSTFTQNQAILKSQITTLELKFQDQIRNLVEWLDRLTAANVALKYTTKPQLPIAKQQGNNNKKQNSQILSSKQQIKKHVEEQISNKMLNMNLDNRVKKVQFQFNKFTRDLESATRKDRINARMQICQQNIQKIIKELELINQKKKSRQVVISQQSQQNEQLQRIQPQKMINQMKNIQPLKPSIQLKNWIDQKCYSFKLLRLNANLISSKCNANIFGKFIQSSKWNFSVYISKKDIEIGLGIIDSSLKMKEKLQNQHHQIQYRSDGTLWYSGKIRFDVKTLKKLNKGDIIVVQLDVKQKSITWSVDTKIIYNQKISFPDFSVIKWVPYIHLYRNGGSVKILK